MTLLLAPLIGIASALLTMLLTPTLQHYFWTRQRHAERQLAVIDELNTLAAEVHFCLLTAEDISPDRRECFAVVLARTVLNIRSLFSSRAYEWFQPLSRAIREAIGLVEPDEPTPHDQRASWLFQAHADALNALYQGMGIPPWSPATYGWVKFLFFTRGCLPPLKGCRVSHD